MANARKAKPRRKPAKRRPMSTKRILEQVDNIIESIAGVNEARLDMLRQAQLTHGEMLRRLVRVRDQVMTLSLMATGERKEGSNG